MPSNMTSLTWYAEQEIYIRQSTFRAKWSAINWRLRATVVNMQIPRSLHNVRKKSLWIQIIWNKVQTMRFVDTAKRLKNLKEVHLDICMKSRLPSPCIKAATDSHLWKPKIFLYILFQQTFSSLHWLLLRLRAPWA